MKNKEKIEEVKSGEYKIFEAQDNLKLCTVGLGDEIAVSLFSPELKKVAFARNPSPEQLRTLFAKINPENLQQSGLIKVQLVGGTNSEKSTKSAETMVATLSAIDNGTDIINITSFDVCGRLHPESIEIDCYHGGMRQLTGNHSEV